MYTHNRSTRLIRALAPASLIAGVFVTAAMLSSAHSNPEPSGFAVLGNAAVTLTDATVTGDVGTFLASPGGSVTQTNSVVVGTVHVGDAASQAAFNDFLSAYAALAPQPGDLCTTLVGTLAGVTLSPGVYCFDAAATLTGTLTLDGPANAIWIFKIGTSGTGALTGTDFKVVMAGGGQPCNVTWWVAEAATMTTSDFLGNILAGAAITLTGGTFGGNAWAQADVTITGTATAGCAGGKLNGKLNGNGNGKCNQGLGNGPEQCDPGDSNHHNPSNDENGEVPGDPGRK